MPILLSFASLIGRMSVILMAYPLFSVALVGILLILVANLSVEQVGLILLDLEVHYLVAFKLSLIHI